MGEGSPRFAAERHERILRLLRERGAMSLRSLAGEANASEVTVRRDLRVLEEQGLLERSRGGAVPLGGAAREPSHRHKTTVAVAEKAAIAERAAALVRPDTAVALGPGTTTHRLALRLAGIPGLTVITNSLLVASALADAEGIEVVLTGGTLRGSIHALVGSAAEGFLSTVRVHRAFLSGNGLTAERGLSTPNLTVAGVDRALARCAREVAVLADHTKVGGDALFATVPPDRIAHLVTDARAAGPELDALTAAGAAVHLTEPS
ncbi:MULTISPECIES: DeoR/GlpR family DNA-binding transcription regulator [Actinomadura]|uniref:DeoR/GlpR family DNA-binding transcription regulator n=1 Tax=Actinomadura yumaensis TaxID=111807 RepID=A0ABW2CIH1_9ACTN|nr:DeoR/GlpR family DNA-binding transcription regulator [Actinomadura sp. J1-007]MWK40644.1 DeoR family transcriptional regulator [Actinomadura sp. J1-007]